ncbi:helix-turn-helix domain-containing protein [Hamadaea tsunoensis]|uniref:helix-turn-helix domain-containing protein n=1 Tax=Hamadaea tsunoensis TaxID=53368 RepID=UPI00041DB25B|nr:helix-turn-helix domain-containing protein [Hamadaea tsunoensis]
MTDDHLMTSKELATYLRQTERFVRRLVAGRKIEYVKSGRAVRFTRQAVADYIERNRVQPTSRAELRRAILEGLV